MIPSITDDDVEEAIGALLTAILPSNVPAFVGQTNRVPTPEGDYVEFWPLRRPRFSTNVETSTDTKFTASIASIDVNTAAMTVTAIAFGSIDTSNPVIGVGVALGTSVQSQTSGAPGGVGVYIITPSQAVSSTTMSAGTTEIEQSTEVVYQIDVHGQSSADNAQVISTILRSSFAVDQMDGTGITPLFADDPMQTPFITAANQYENRWSVDAHFQIAPSVSTPQEFSDSTTLTIVDVDVAYPPS